MNYIHRETLARESSGPKEVKSDLCKIDLPDSMQDSSVEDICRICEGSGQPDSPLITPCYCTDSLRYVHKSCLLEGIKSSSKKYCESCKFHFILKMQPFRKRKELPGYKESKLQNFILLHTAIILGLAFAMYVQIMFFKTINPLESRKKRKILITSIAFCVIEPFCLFIHGMLLWEWWKFNRIIDVQNAPEEGIIADDQQQKKADFSVAANPTVDVLANNYTTHDSSDKDEFLELPECEQQQKY